MQRVSHKVENRSTWLEMRRRNINASDMAALFHCHPYKTALQLWAEHMGKLDEDDSDSVAMRRGRILEPAVAAGLKEAHPDWVIKPAQEYVEMPVLKIGCTPDFWCWPSMTAWDDDVASSGGTPVQAKTVLEGVYLDDWAAAPPAHYLIQVQTEMLVLGKSEIILAAMVLDNRAFPVHEFVFKADEDFQAAIITAAERFQDHLKRGVEPNIKPGQDGAVLARMFPDSQAEPVLGLHGDSDFLAACSDHQAAATHMKFWEGQKADAAGRIMNKLRNHGKAVAQDYSVNWTTIPAMTVTQNRKAHRRLTVNRKKGS